MNSTGVLFPADSLSLIAIILEVADHVVGQLVELGLSQ
jgi:hypothetical protein